MSTAALQYESASDMANRSPFSWQVIESSNGLLDNDLGAYATDLTFPSSTGQGSAVASPPRGPLTAEQRELKRQRDLARRDSKRAVRTRRTDSGSSYMPSPPGTLPDMAGSPSAMPVYSTAPAQISLLADPPSTLPSQPYLNPYSAPVGDQGQTDLFPNPYAPPSYISVDYPPNYPVSSAPSLSTNYGTQTMPDPNLIYQPPMSLGASSVGSQEGHVRVVQARPKPQCWEHGCNGRQFSTFSNLLRHQREKSGQAAKATCPNCGAEFTRTTARNGHLLHDKCKQKKTSTTSGSSNNSRANSRS
ncbi:hypothetical protein VTK73DRAFT_2797 [Phialemonium thermophilum]|uniref:C2H2-type domain-containing protein n=1 Tax=Phialemonium thermophilum TaxID=223376 RepID=A0ABR3X2Z1_9PEZI